VGDASQGGLDGVSGPIGSCGRLVKGAECGTHMQGVIWRAPALCSTGVLYSRHGLRHGGSCLMAGGWGMGCVPAQGLEVGETRERVAGVGVKAVAWQQPSARGPEACSWW
jgi:hypothetical protein